MAHLGFKHSAFIDLPGSGTLTINGNIPSVKSFEVHETLPFIIQGNTVATFVLSALQPTAAQRDTLGQSYAGIDQLIFDPGDGSSIKKYKGQYNNAFAFNLSATVLPLTSFQHTYFSTVTGATELSARVTIVYTQTAGSGIVPQVSALSASHIIPFKQTAENVVDRNLEILDSQVFTHKSDIVPMLVFETDENIIYPTGFFEVNPPRDPNLNIYINTDPENSVNTTEEYIRYTSFFLTSALSADDASNAGADGLGVYGNATNLLSGVAFQQAGRSGARYTTVFSITGDEPFLQDNSNAFTTSLQSISALLNNESILVNVNVTPLTAATYADRYTTLFAAISTAYDEAGLIGDNEAFANIVFTASSTQNNEIKFVHQYMPPPAATLNTVTPFTSAVKGNFIFTNELAVAGRQSLGLTTSQAGSAVTFLYPTSSYPLTASGRISTDPSGDNITAI